MEDRCEQLARRVDVKCEEILLRPRPTKGDVTALVGLCRKLIAALEEEKRVATRNTEGREVQ